MARLRTLKPGYFTNEDLAGCSIWARVAFQGLWVEADREGRLKDQPLLLHGRIFPFDVAVDMEALLTELARPGLILRYRVGGRAFIAIPTWHKHQRPHWKEPPSVIPPPDEAGPPSAPDGAPDTAPSRAPGTIPWPSTRQRVEPADTTSGFDPGHSPGHSLLGIWDLGSGIRSTHTHRAREPEAAGCGNPAHAWCGQRFCVPRFLADEWRRLNPGDDLDAWYAAEDAAAVASQEPLGPDAVTWLRRRYRARQLAAVSARPAARRLRHDPADQGASTCDHTPRCRSITACIARTLADGRALAARARSP